MKRPSLTNRFGGDQSSIDEQMKESVVDALSSNDKVIEIRPASRSRRMGPRRLLLLGAGAIGLAYWAQKSQKPNDLVKSAKEKPNQVIGNVKEKAATTTGQAAETIEEGSETASERIEGGSERAGEAVQEAGEKAADRTEEAGETVAEEADSDTSGSSGT